MSFKEKKSFIYFGQLELQANPTMTGDIAIKCQGIELINYVFRALFFTRVLTEQKFSRQVT